MSSKKTLLNLFLNGFVLSAFAFGGGSTIIALFQRRFVEELQWLDGTSLLDILTQAQSLPGATVVNTSVLLGYRVKGVRGALTCALATSLPPLLAIMLVAVAYDRILNSASVANVMRAMRACAAAMVANAVLTMLLNLRKNRNAFQAGGLLAAFAIILLFHPPTYLIILGGLALGVLHAVVPISKDRR